MKPYILFQMKGETETKIAYCYAYSRRNAVNQFKKCSPTMPHNFQVREGKSIGETMGLHFCNPGF